MKKVLALLLAIFVTLAGTLYLGTVRASTDVSGMPEPSVPGFTIKAVATSIEVTIKNQQLTSYENGNYPSYYFGFRFKDHNAMIGFWNYDPIYFVLPSTYGGYYKSSDSDFTIVYLSLEGYHFPSGKIDIQAIALVGNQYPTNIQNGAVYGVDGVISGWSETQTLIIEENQTPTPTEEPQRLEQDMTAGAILAVASIVVFLGLLFYFIKRK